MFQVLTIHRKQDVSTHNTHLIMEMHVAYVKLATFWERANYKKIVVVEARGQFGISGLWSAKVVVCYYS